MIMNETMTAPEEAQEGVAKRNALGNVASPLEACREATGNMAKSTYYNLATKYGPPETFNLGKRKFCLHHKWNEWLLMIAERQRQMHERKMEFYNQFKKERGEI